MLKIVHVIWHLGQGGAQTYLYQLVRYLMQRRKDFYQEILVLSSPGPLSEQFHETGISIHYAGMKSGLDVLGAFRVFFILRRSGARIIHSHSNNMLFNVGQNYLGTPVIYTEHGGALLGGRMRDRLLYRYLYRPICRFIAISQEMARVMSCANPLIADRVVTIPNGVNVDDIDAQAMVSDAEWSSVVNGSRYYIGIIGRLVEQKGVDLFIEVAENLISRRDDVGFVIVGDGPLRVELEHVVNVKNIAGKVIFAGYRSDGIAWMKRFDVFLFTSKFEPFGLVITEAMAAGVPVVAAHRRGAVPEIVENGQTGLVVEGDQTELLAECVTKVLDDPDLREHIVANAKQMVAFRFSIAANADAIAAVYENCVGR